MVCFFIWTNIYYTMILCDDEATRWLCVWYTHIYNDFTMMRCNEDMVMLRSTTGPYGRPVIEVAYGEMILSLHRGCMGDDSSGKVVGVSTWCIAHIWHTRINTSVSSMYIIFWFLRYKNLYIYVIPVLLIKGKIIILKLSTEIFEGNFQISGFTWLFCQF